MTSQRRVNTGSADDHRLDLIFQALADSTRRAIVARLADGPLPVTVLATPFAMSLAAVSKHIRVLERAGLIRRAVDGRVHRCSLAPSPLAEAEQWLQDYRAFWTGTLDAVARYVERDRPSRRAKRA